MFIGEIFGPDLLIVIIVLAVLLFGGAAIPKFAKNLGAAKTEFESGMKASKSAKAELTETITRVSTPGSTS
jgi:Sec-independent protein translocase protein TatA